MAGQNYCVVDGCLLPLRLCRRGFQDLFKIRPGNYTEENMQHTENGESLKSRKRNVILIQRINGIFQTAEISGLQNTRVVLAERISKSRLNIGILKYIFFPVALRPNAGHGLLILDVSRSHTAMHHSR